jgi:F-type H+-transporting ATPase subunit b
MAEPTGAHTQAEDGHKGPFPPFNSETYASQLVWLVLTFVALYVVMSKIALPRIGGIIDARQKQIASDLAEAQRLKEEAEAATVAYEKKLAEARSNAHDIAAKTRDKLMAAADERRKATEDRLNKKLEEADKAIAATKAAAMSNVAAIATDAAAAIVQRLVGVMPDVKAVSDAVAEALKR